MPSCAMHCSRYLEYIVEWKYTPVFVELLVVGWEEGMGEALNITQKQVILCGRKWKVFYKI